MELLELLDCSRCVTWWPCSTRRSRLHTISRWLMHCARPSSVRADDLVVLALVACQKRATRQRSSTGGGLPVILGLSLSALPGAP